MYWYTDDPVADFDRWDADQYRRQKRHPRCAHCDEYVQNTRYYLINDSVICPDCLEIDFGHDVDEYIDCD